MKEAPSDASTRAIWPSGTLPPVGTLTRILRIASMVSRYSGFQRTTKLKRRSPGEHLGHCLAADCRLHDGGDVAGIETVARRHCPIRFDDNVGLAERAEHKHVGDAAHLLECLGNSVSDRFVSIKIITEDLDRIRSRLNA